MAEQLSKFEEIKADDNLRQSMASMCTVKNTRVKQRILNQDAFKGESQNEESKFLISSRSPSHEENILELEQNQAMSGDPESDKTNNTASFNCSYKNEQNYGCGTIGALAQLNSGCLTSFIRLNKSDAADDQSMKSIGGGLGEINNGDQIYIDDKISSHTLQTNQIF